MPLLVLTISALLSAGTLSDADMMRGNIAQLSATHAKVDTSVLINAAASVV